MKNLALALCLLSLYGCASYYGPKGPLGGYEDYKRAEHIYLIEYYGDQIGVSNTDLHTQWNRRAQELCQSQDYYVYFPQNQKRNFQASLSGFAYCNSGFSDTRLTQDEAEFQRFIDLPEEAFFYRELTPLFPLLINKDFSKLEDAMGDLFEKRGQPEVTENQFDLILYTFARVNPDLEAIYKEWIQAYPKSAYAYLATSLYYIQTAWEERGSAYYSDLTEKQRLNFKRYQKLSLEYADKALLLNDDVAFHALKINILTTYGASEKVDKAYQTAIQKYPQSLLPYKAYFRATQPKWGGSVEKMQQLVDDAVKGGVNNDDVNQIRARSIAQQADALYRSQKYDEAAELYSEAIQLSEYAYIYLQRAQIYIRQKNYVSALQDQIKAIQLDPYYIRAADDLVKSFLRVSKHFDALAASIAYTAINSQSVFHHDLQGDIFYGMRRYEDAKRRYEKAYELSELPVYRHKIRKAEYQIKVREKTDKLKKTGQGESSI